jgi:chromosome segregation ATPase
MTDELITKYDSLSRKIQERKDQISRLKGKIESLDEELKGLGFKNINDALKWLEEAKEEFRILNVKIQETVTEIEKLIDELK